MLVLGEAAGFGRSRATSIVRGECALVANSGPLFNREVGGHPGDKQTRVSARSEMMNVAPETVNPACRVGVAIALGEGMLAFPVALSDSILVGSVGRRRI